MASMGVRVSGTALLLCVVSALVGCAAADTSASSTRGNQYSTPQPDPLQTPGPSLARQLPAASPAVEVSAADAASGLSMPWRFLGFVGGDDLVDVAAVAGDGDCVKPVGFHVHREGSDVVVEAVSREEPGRAACADRLVLSRAVLRLPASFGGMVRLVHAVTDPQWSSPNYLR